MGIKLIEKKMVGKLTESVFFYRHRLETKEPYDLLLNFTQNCTKKLLHYIRKYIFRNQTFANKFSYLRTKFTYERLEKKNREEIIRVINYEPLTDMFCNIKSMEPTTNLIKLCIIKITIPLLRLILYVEHRAILR